MSFIWATGVIMESLCLVKSHEITRATAGVYSAAAARERGRETQGQRERRGGGFNSARGEVSLANVCVCIGN